MGIQPDEEQQVDIFEILRRTIIEEEPIDDLGYRIEDELNKRGDNLSVEEKDLAWHYFKSDFAKSIFAASRYINRANESNPESEEYKQHLRKAYYFIRRASKHVTLAMRIYPSVPKEANIPNVDYQGYLDSLQSLWVKYCHIAEFPTCGKEIIGLESELEDAIQEEDYESAARLRDRIEEVVSGKTRVESDDSKSRKTEIPERCSGNLRARIVEIYRDGRPEYHAQLLMSGQEWTGPVAARDIEYFNNVDFKFFDRLQEATLRLSKGELDLTELEGFLYTKPQ